MASNKYKYTIEISYMQDGVEKIINFERILTMTIDYDYDKRNMPIILLRLGIDKRLLDHMIKNDNKILILTVNKYDESDSINIYKTIIKGEFFYFLDSNINYFDDLDYGNETNKENADVYKIVSMGLMKKDLILNNKVLINTIYKDNYLIDIICDNFTKNNLVIEPLRYNKKIDSLIVQPIETLSKFISYLDNQFTLYNTQYRLFFDFNKTYLLSSSGNGIPIKNEKYNSIFLYVNNTVTLDSRVQGMTEDDKQKAYIVYIDSNNINISVDNATALSYNQIIGIDSEGNSKSINLDTSVDGNRYKITRINNSNLDKLDNIKENIESNKTVIHIIKQELDSSIFTLNKQYYIKNYNKLANNDGKFLLSAKKEVYVRETKDFQMTSIFTFKKCPSE